MRLKVNDIILDSGEDVIIAQTYETNNFGDLSTRNGGFSNDFTLPLTVKNEKALGFPSELNNSDRSPYRKVPAQLIDVGATISIGYLRYKVVDDKNIRCAFFTDNTEWFNLIKDKKMSDLDLSDYDHTWDYTTVAAAMNANKDSGYIYPLIDYGHFIGESLSTTTSIDSDKLFPGMFVHSLVEQIFKDIGWRVGGELHDYAIDTPYRRMIQPFSAEEFVHSDQFIANNTQKRNAISQTLPIGGTPNPLDNFIVWNGGAPTGFSPTNYNISTQINITVSGFSSSWANRAYIYIGATQVATVLFVLNQDGDFSVLLNYTGFIDVAEDVEVSIVEISARPGGETVTIETSSAISVSPVAELSAGDNVEMATTMPDMLQSDFLKYIFFSFGVIPQPNNYAKKVDLDLFRTVKDNIPLALDWSGKLDVGKKISTDFTKLLNDYSRVSIMNYEDDDDDPELMAYKAETKKNFGQGQFDIDNDHLEKVKEIYTAPYVPMININSFNNELYIPQIKWFVEDPDNPGTFNKEFEPRAKIAIMSENIAFSLLSGGLSDEISIKDPDSASTIAVPSVSFTWFAKTQYIPVIDNINQSLAYGQVLFPNVIGETMKEAYLKDYEFLLSNMKYVEAFFRLNEVDINNLDFIIPIYIDRFKAYFYINKIKDYRGSERATKVELIKIGNG